jgi:pyruvate dehydrogenase E1 component alpha subunit
MKFDILKVYKLLLKIRFAENLLAVKKRDGYIISPVHLSVGQEIIPVAVAQNCIKGDIFFGNHRSHHHLLALDSNVTKFFAEILCKKKGLSKGYGASMHLVDKSKGFYGSVPIVTGSVPLATGAAFALKFKKKKNIAVSYLGDGAVEEGVFHESLIFSGKKKLPILYVIENNEYSSNVHISERQISNNLSRFASAYGIKSLSIDGNNFFKLSLKLNKIISNIRKSSEPFVIETKTYRHFGHVDWQEDIDVGIERSLEKLSYWKKKDGIKLLEKYILKKKLLNKSNLKKIHNKIHNEINSSWKAALSFPPQVKSDLYKNVFHV